MDTLKYYEELVSNGVPEAQAKIHTYAMEGQEKTVINQFKGEFASNKLVALIGTIIISIGGFTLAKIWDLSHDMVILSHDMVDVKNRLCLIEDKVLK